MAEKTRNYYKTSKKWREHEIELATLKAFAADPELKYFMGVAAGAGIATLGELMKKTSPPAEGGGSSPIYEPGAAEAFAFGWLLGPVNPVSATWYIQQLATAKETDKTTGLPLDEIMVVSGMGFAGFCTAVLLLKAMSGGKEGGFLGGIVGAVA